MMATLVGAAAWAVTGRPRTAARLNAARAARNRRGKKGSDEMRAGKKHAGWAAVHARSPYGDVARRPMANGTTRAGTSGTESAVGRGICHDGADDQLHPARPAQRGDHRARRP